MPDSSNYMSLETCFFEDEDHTKVLRNRKWSISDSDLDRTTRLNEQSGVEATPEPSSITPEVTVNDGAGGQSLGDLNQRSHTFKLPRYEIKDNETPFHLLQAGSGESTNLSNPYTNLLPWHFDVDFGSMQGAYSSTIPTGTVKTKSEEYSYHPELLGPDVNEQSTDTHNVERDIAVPPKVKTTSNSRRYQGLWPRTYPGPRRCRSEHIPMSIAKRIYTQDDSFNPSSITPNVAEPAGALVPSSSMEPSVAYGPFAQPDLGRDVSHSSNPQPHPQSLAAANYDGGSPVHDHDTRAYFVPSTLESIDEDASGNHISTNTRAKERALKSYQRITSSPLSEPAKIGGYLRGSPPLPELSATAAKHHNISTKSKDELLRLSKEHETEVHRTRRNLAGQSQIIPSPNGIAVEISASDQHAVKSEWLPRQKNQSVKSSSSIYSQSDSPSITFKIAYETLPYQHVDSHSKLEHTSSGQSKEAKYRARISLVMQQLGFESPGKIANSKQRISKCTAHFTRRHSKRRNTTDDVANDSTSTVKRMKAPSKLSSLGGFSFKFRPVLSKNTSKKYFAETLPSEYPGSAVSREDESKSVPTEAVAENWKQHDIVNSIEATSSPIGNQTTATTPLATTSNLRPSKELIKPGSTPTAKDAETSNSLQHGEMEDVETLMMMIEDLEKRLDKALNYASSAANKVDADIFVDTPQEQARRGIELPRSRPRRLGPIPQGSLSTQPEDSSDTGGDLTYGSRSRFEKASYASGLYGEMGHDPLAMACNLASNETDEISTRISGAPPLTSSSTLASAGTSTLESISEILSDILSDNVIPNPPVNSELSDEILDNITMESTVTDFNSTSRIVPQKMVPRYTALAANLKKEMAAVRQAREQMLSKGRILRSVTTNNPPPVPPRHSSHAAKSPRRRRFEPSFRVPMLDSGPRSLGTRALRANTSMDGALEADDEMESDTEYIIPRTRRNVVMMRCSHNIRDETRSSRSVRRGRDTSGRHTPDWPLRDPPTLLGRGVRPMAKSNSQREFFISRSRQYSGARDLSAADEMIVSVAAVISIVLVIVILGVDIAFGLSTGYLSST